MNSSEEQKSERWVTLGVGDGTERQKLLCALSGNVPWHSHFRKHDGRTQKVNSRNPTLHVYSPELFSHRVPREHGQACGSELHVWLGVIDKPDIYPQGNGYTESDRCTIIIPKAVRNQRLHTCREQG